MAFSLRSIAASISSVVRGMHQMVALPASDVQEPACVLPQLSSRRDEMILRPATAADSAAVAGVVEAVYAEYGFAWEPEGCQADLSDLGAHYLDRGHLVWVVTEATGIQGVIGLRLFEPVQGPMGSAVELDGAVRLAGCDSALA